MAKRKRIAALEAAPTDIVAEMAAGGDHTRQVVDWINDVTARADDGDQDALELALQAYAAVPALWPKANVLRDHAERMLLDRVVDGDRQLLTRATVERQLKTMRDELAGPNPTEVERILVDRVVLCWLACQQADVDLIHRTQAGVSLTQGEYLQRRAERAERRLLRATKTLATVRRLLVPIVQVNVADQIQQLNVVGSQPIGTEGRYNIGIF